jgi:hypothetical protein
MVFIDKGEGKCSKHGEENPNVSGNHSLELKARAAGPGLGAGLITRGIPEGKVIRMMSAVKRIRSSKVKEIIEKFNAVKEPSNHEEVVEKTGQMSMASKKNKHDGLGRKIKETNATDNAGAQTKRVQSREDMVSKLYKTTGQGGTTTKIQDIVTTNKEQYRHQEYTTMNIGYHQAPQVNTTPFNETAPLPFTATELDILFGPDSNARQPAPTVVDNPICRETTHIANELELLARQYASLAPSPFPLSPTSATPQAPPALHHHTAGSLTISPPLQQTQTHSSHRATPSNSSSVYSTDDEDAFHLAYYLSPRRNAPSQLHPTSSSHSRAQTSVGTWLQNVEEEGEEYGLRNLFDVPVDGKVWNWDGRRWVGSGDDEGDNFFGPP